MPRTEFHGRYGLFVTADETCAGPVRLFKIRHHYLVLGPEPVISRV
jgi:hypothetical protein